MPRVAGGHRNCRRDDNHNDVVGWYEQAGCSVIDLSDVGGGVPDLLIGCAGEDGLAEVKTADGELSASQKRFNRDYRGRKPWTVRTLDDVLAHVAFLRKRARAP